MPAYYASSVDLKSIHNFILREFILGEIGEMHICLISRSLPCHPKDRN